MNQIIKSLKNIARDGDRTHAHIRELDLKSNALTTRPPGLINQIISKINHYFIFILLNFIVKNKF